MPRIDHINIQLREVPDVSCRKLRPTCDDNSSNLRIAHINRLPRSLPAGSQLGCRFSSGLIKITHASIGFR
jgi:hypothetical protein